MITLRPLTSSLWLIAVLPSIARAQQYDPSLFAELHWRPIGPFRGGRTVAATGVPGQSNLFYIGVNNGGVWRTTDYGRTWAPLFDSQPTGSIGALAVAAAEPNVIYVGSGEGLQRPDLSVGDGIYKSSDAGRTWRHLGLADGQQIPAVVVDPHDARRVLVAVLGHPYGANTERGVFRSTDGGESWQRVLYQDENTGAVEVAFDPANPQTVFAVLWAARQAPWEIGSSWTLSANNGLYKSTDGGTTWRRITVGLPTAEDKLGRIGLGMCASEPGRMYAVLGAAQGGGVYRSDDGGEHWHRVNADPRLWGRDGDFNEVKVDPKNADVLYVANVVTWKSTDGGRTFTAFRGAPGGDDYHRLWINPDDPKIILLAGDQGAVVTVNGGATWSSWYNQPTAQFYHVSTDHQFPYRVYGGQQESGSAGIVSRGNDGQITFREWRPVGAEEYGYVAPDPLHPDIVYGGKISRFDWSTGQVQDVSPEPVRMGKYRWVRTMPVVFSPVDPRVLYLGANVVFKTLNGGERWQTISPDLTRPTAEVPASLGAFAPLDPEQGRHRGVIYTIAPSFTRPGLLWVGTDDGLIHVTHDGGRRWTDVTPTALTPWSKVSLMEASHFDTLVAYAAVNRFRLDDLRPHIYRTKDGGRTWTEVVEGMPSNEAVNAVREDPVRRGLLYAGTERVRVVRRRWSLAIAAARSAGELGARPRRARHRPGRGDAWTLVLDPRRHHPAAPGRGGRRCRRGGRPLSVPPGARRSSSLERQHRHAAPPRRARGQEPTRRRDARLLPGPTGGGTRGGRDSRPVGRPGAPVCERRSSRAPRHGGQHSSLMDPTVAGACDRAGDASLRVGPARRPAPRAAARVSDFRHPR